MIKADLLFTNANVLTMDNQNPRAGSIAVTNGRISGIWSEPVPPRDEINVTRHTEILNLNSATLIPGFIDTHNHILMYAKYKKQVNCSTPPNKNIQDIQERIRNSAENTPVGEWIFGYGYDDTLLQEKRHPTRAELDIFAPNHPVYVNHISGHFAVVNSMGLERANINEETSDPRGGHFGRDENGKLNGILYELPALTPVQTILPSPSVEDMVSLLGTAAQDYLTHGITTNTDAAVGSFHGISELDAHLQAVLQGVNPMHMRLMIMHEFLSKGGVFEGYSAAKLDTEIRSRSHDRARLDSAKLFQDGSIQGLTAALRDPYTCEPDLFGELLIDQDELNEKILELHRRGYRVAIHGNGDRAIGSILDAYTHALHVEPRYDHRHRIEHVQTATLNDLDRMKQLSIACSFFINHVYYWGDRHKRLFLGQERANRINPLADAMKRNLLFTLHSDCAVTPISPLFSIWAAVNRVTREGDVLGADQRCDVETALRAMTIDGAKLNFEENETGSIEWGKRADFTILQSDPTSINPIEIKDIPILATIIDGRIVYGKESIG
jgi:predicted amidohydrolase YtcJ